MRDDLLLNYAQAGWLNTANAAGYLVGALLTRLWVVRMGNRALFMAGMLVTSLAVLATGLTRDPALLSLMRFVGGVGGAAVFVCGGALSGNIRSAVVTPGPLQRAAIMDPGHGGKKKRCRFCSNV